MAGLKETATWENHIYQIEENDPVHGGENGITNKPNKQLANRTAYLRKMLTEAGQRLTPKKITATSQNSNDLTGHTHEIDLASLTKKGLVQLTNDTGLDSESLALTAKGAKALSQRIAGLEVSTPRNLNDLNNKKVDKSAVSSAVNSTSTTNVANSLAVKIAYDKGVEALNKARQVDAETLKKNGNQSINGILKAENINGAWAAYQFGALGGVWQMEANPAGNTSGNRRFNMKWIPDSGPSIYLRFPHISDEGEMVAYQSFVNAEVQKVRSIANQNSQNFNNYIHNTKKSNAVDNSSTDTVATSRAVKLAYDRGTTALEVANTKLGNSGNQTLNGYLKTTYSSSRGWAGYQFDAAKGVWQLEASPGADVKGNRQFNMKWLPNSGKEVRLNFPDISDNGDTVAYRSWVNELFVGIPLPWMSSSVPTGFLAMNGQRFDKQRYPILGERYPNGVLPDLRGEFIRGWDNGRGVDINRGLLSNQNQLVGEHKHRINPFYSSAKKDSIKEGKKFRYEIGAATSVVNVDNKFSGDVHDNLSHIGIALSWGSGGSMHSDNFISMVGDYRETRPRNVAFQYICLAA